METPNDRAVKAVTAILAKAEQELQTLSRTAHESSTQQMATAAFNAVGRLIETF